MTSQLSILQEHPTEDADNAVSPPPGIAREVQQVPVTDEMEESFLAYSLSVITSRAIPDVRDGLKPVQRRILYSMLSMGIRPDGPHRKSARVVGDTMGKYHPHGDAAIYDALVRMAQDFTRQITLVDPHGNFGTLDDPPAAPRYTECRLAESAMEMLREIDEDTVDMRPTYDGESTEPECLPALLPNLLVNGTSGIAVGMATNMACHNLREVYEAIKLVMTRRRPKVTLDELLEVLAGPDFPSGGIVIRGDNGDDGLREAYASGRGSFRMRARMQPERLTRTRWGIVVTELPYMVGPEKVVKRINDLIVDGKLAGAHDARNLSDRHHGLQILIECKPHVEPESLYYDLYRLTPLEEVFAVNNVVLVNGVPSTLGLYDLCRYYIDHRLDVVVRRSRHRLDRAQQRLHITEGLLTALDAIDLVVSIIRGSDDAATARQRLMDELRLSEVQATHILDMQLRRLTALERQRLADEREELLHQIAQLEKLLGSEQRQRTLVLKELEQAVQEYGTDRRTEIIAAADAEVARVEAPPPAAEPCEVTLSTSAALGRSPVGADPRGTLGRHDVLAATTPASTAATLLAVTSEGRVLAAPVAEVPEVTGRSRGAPASKIFGTGHSETVLTVAVLEGTEPPAEHLMLVTAGGIAKRLTAQELADVRPGRPVIRLKPGDSLAAVFWAPEGADMVLVSSDGRALRTATDGVPVRGRAAAGVIGMKLAADARVVAADVAQPGHWLILHTADEQAVTLDAVDVASAGRGTLGTRVHKAGELVGAVLAVPDRVVAVAEGSDRPQAAPVPLRELLESGNGVRILDVGVARW